MILVDTNILIDFFNDSKSKFAEILKSNELATCGIVLTELLRGCSSKKEQDLIKNGLSCMLFLDFEKTDWEKFADLLIRLKKSGIAVPFQDGMIAYLAIKNNCEILTNDKHFLLMKKSIGELQLFEN